MQHLLTPGITDMNLSPADPQSNSVDTVIISQTTVKSSPLFFIIYTCPPNTTINNDNDKGNVNGLHLLNKMANKAIR